MAVPPLIRRCSMPSALRSSDTDEASDGARPLATTSHDGLDDHCMNHIPRISTATTIRPNARYCGIVKAEKSLRTRSGNWLGVD